MRPWENILKEIKRFSVRGPRCSGCLCVFTVCIITMSNQQRFFLTSGYINGCYFILTGQIQMLRTFHILYIGITDGLILKMTCKALGITGTCTFKPFHTCMYIGQYTWSAWKSICLENIFIATKRNRDWHKFKKLNRPLPENQSCI